MFDYLNQKVDDIVETLYGIGEINERMFRRLSPMISTTPFEIGCIGDGINWAISERFSLIVSRNHRQIGASMGDYSYLDTKIDSKFLLKRCLIGMITGLFAILFTFMLHCIESSI